MPEARLVPVQRYAAFTERPDGGNPAGVVLDAAGNLFIADRNNEVVRKVDPAGTITTVAGTGRFGFSGDGGPATLALLNNPFATAVDTAGNLYISDEGNHRVRRVAAGVDGVIDGEPDEIITTVAGVGVGCVPIPRDPLDPLGDPMCAGELTPNGTPALLAPLAGPRGVAWRSGGLYIADHDNQRIRLVNFPL